MMDGEFSVRFVPSSAQPLTFDESLCIGCNICVETCQVDILLPTQSRASPRWCLGRASAITAAAV
jgi:ferredoxin